MRLLELSFALYKLDKEIAVKPTNLEKVLPFISGARVQSTDGRSGVFMAVNVEGMHALRFLRLVWGDGGAIVEW